MTDIEKDVAERFAAEVTKHEMTVLHNDGLYRHLRFRRPDYSGGWFDLITWPGNLAIKGDHGGYMFARQDDMFEFFRHNGNQHGINPGYWAEKLPDHGKSVQEYSEGILRDTLEPHLVEYEQGPLQELLAEYREAKARYDALSPEGRRHARFPFEPKSPRDLVKERDEDGYLFAEDSVRAVLGELETLGVVSDTWEWDLKDWNYHYLWCCHAIVWGIAQFDALVSEPAGAAA